MNCEQHVEKLQQQTQHHAPVNRTNNQHHAPIAFFKMMTLTVVLFKEMEEMQNNRQKL